VAVQPSTRTRRTKEERALVWRQDIRILPLSSATYLLCFLDRANIGNARKLNSTHNNHMQYELHMTEYQFVMALLVFLVAYGLFEVPSNLLLKKLRPSRWIAFLMFTWGVFTICLGACQTFSQLAAVRWLLGMAEAGLFPGLTYYLTFWYRHDERSVRVAMIIASATLAGAFGGAIAYGIGHLNQAQGLSGWRWLFILEGVPSSLAAIVVWFCLPDFPETASWLSTEEKELAIRRLEFEGSKHHHRTITWADTKAIFTDWRLYGHYAIYIAVSIPFASMAFFVPSILIGLGYKDLQAQLMSVPPWVAGYSKSRPFFLGRSQQLTKLDSNSNPTRGGVAGGPFELSRMADRRTRYR
jgi:MFS family permease